MEEFNPLKVRAASSLSFLPRTVASFRFFQASASSSFPSPFTRTGFGGVGWILERFALFFGDIDFEDFRVRVTFLGTYVSRG